MLAAPTLSEADRQLLADGTADNTDDLDTQPGLYVLLRNASTWKGDDFGGDAGAAVAPPPDYAFLKTKPDQARGNVYLIEGWLMGADRWPTLANHSSDKLAVDPAWGDQVTRWTVVTEKGNPAATIIVLFYDPNAKMSAPEPGSKVRIAARFHKLWTIKDQDGKPFTYVTFVGGAAQATEAAGGASRSTADGSMSELHNIVSFSSSIRPSKSGISCGSRLITWITWNRSGKRFFSASISSMNMIELLVRLP